MGRRRKKPTKDATQLEIYRYEASLTVDDLAEQTRIPQRHLLALEARELDKLPAPVFISGYLRNLAEFFEVDVNLLLSDYDFSKEDNLISSLQQDDSSVDEIPLIQIYLNKVSSFFKSLSDTTSKLVIFLSFIIARAFDAGIFSFTTKGCFVIKLFSLF